MITITVMVACVSPEIRLGATPLSAPGDVSLADWFSANVDYPFNRRPFLNDHPSAAHGFSKDFRGEETKSKNNGYPAHLSHQPPSSVNLEFVFSEFPVFVCFQRVRFSQRALRSTHTGKEAGPA